jgi:nitrate/nitrite transport system substrate-binding protein
MSAPKTTSKPFSVMAKTFNPDKPEEYINSFAIKRTAA